MSGTTQVLASTGRAMAMTFFPCFQPAPAAALFAIVSLAARLGADDEVIRTAPGIFERNAIILT